MSNTVKIDEEIRNLIPPLRDDERTELEASIRRDGCRDALVVWQEAGILIDGHNRYDICTKHGIRYETRGMSFPSRGDAKLWMLRNQLGRRNLDTLTRVQLVEHIEAELRAKAMANNRDGGQAGGLASKALVKLPKPSPADTGSTASTSKSAAPFVVPEWAKTGHPKAVAAPVAVAEKVNTRDDAAKIAGISGKTYVAAKQVLAHGTPELQRAVRDNEASISAAAKVAELPAEKQREIVAKGAKAIIAAAKEASPHRAQGTGENEWYTPDEFLEAARDVMGGIDLDPATSVPAQKKVRAAAFYTVDDDGLRHNWHGNVWLNPPYSQPAIEQFARKIASEVSSGRVNSAVMLTHNYTDTLWFHIAAGAASAICFTRGRIKFYSPSGMVAAPTQGQSFFYFGDDVDRFADVFSKFGFVVTMKAKCLKVSDGAI